MVDHCAAGIEGVVAKRLDEANRPGGRTWRKIRTRNTAEAVIGGVLGPSSSRKALVVGCRDAHGRLHVSGRTVVAGRPIGNEPGSRTAGTVAPMPGHLPSSHFGQLPSEPISYTKVKPRVVVELDVDTAFEDYRWRHARARTPW
jgi:hypothetical protein